MKITFIGGGNMAVALIGGLRKQGFSAAGIQVVEPFAEAREKLTESFGVRCTAAVDAAALDCEALVLAVKPQQLREAVAPLRGKLGTQLVVSIAAGLRMADISCWLGNYSKLVRTMPNTPARSPPASPAVRRPGVIRRARHGGKPQGSGRHVVVRKEANGCRHRDFGAGPAYVSISRGHETAAPARFRCQSARR